MATDMGRRIAAIKFDNPLTPKNVFAENSVQNAAAGLYDFVRSTGSHGGGGFSPAIEREGALDEFEEYLESTRYYGPLVARRWAADFLHRGLRNMREPLPAADVSFAPWRPTCRSLFSTPNSIRCILTMWEESPGTPRATAW